MAEEEPPLIRLFLRSCRLAGRVIRLGDGEGRLRESLSFLGWGVREGEVRALALLSSLLPLLLLTLLPLSPCFLLSPLLSPLLYLAVRDFPVRRAEAERRKGLGEVPELLCSLSTSLLLNPNPEVAGRFAAEGGGRMGRDLRRELSLLLLRVHREAGEALRSLSGRWGRPEELEKPLTLLLASVERGEGRREAVERALELSLGGLRARIEEFVGWLRLPLLLLYSFGILLPLCLLTLLPTVASLGLLSSPLPLALLYCFLLPLLGYLLGSWILSRRPCPSRGERARRRPLSPSFLLPLFLLLFLPLLPGEAKVMAFLWSVTLSLSLYLLPSGREREEERRRLEEERDLPQALAELGNELREGRPLEEALVRVGRAHGWEGGPPGRILSLLRGLAERSEKAAGEAALHLSRHLRRLREVEERGRREMGEILSSLRSVALCFSPLLSSLTCQMYALVWRKGMMAGAPSPPLLLLLLGVHTLSLTFLLLHLASEVEGEGEVGRRWRLASGLPLSLLVFTLGSWGGGMVLGWLT